MHVLKRGDITLLASISCFDLYNLSAQVPLLKAAGISALHFDVVDGRFNDCIILGTPTLEAIRPHTDLPIEVHLGVYEPEKYIRQFVDAGADYIAVHYEVLKDPIRTFDHIKQAGARPLLAFKADTTLDAECFDLLPEVDWVIQLTVNPGYSGQSMKPETIHRIRALRQAMNRLKLNTGIQADGNIHSGTIPAVVEAGADMLTGGTSGLFLKGISLEEAAQSLLKTARYHKERERTMNEGTEA